MKKLIPALVLLLVSAIVLSTSSYAWFSMNRTVQATGISLTAAAPTNLVISVDDTTYNATAALSNPGEDRRLYPASSNDGETFHAIADGNVLGGGLGGKAVAGTTRFLPDNEVTKMEEGKDGWYVEYTLYFKATAATVDPLDIGVKSLTATVADSDIQNAVRVAIDDGVNSPKIYAVDEMENVLPVMQVTEKGEAPDTYYVAEAGDFAADDPKEKVGEAGGDVVAFTVTPGINELGNATQITVRVWIEGEHSACVNANALKDLGLTIEFYVIE